MGQKDSLYRVSLFPLTVCLCPVYVHARRIRGK
jgi:hypothetical protein